MGGCSTGMKQKAKLAQALVHDPRLVFLDRPTNGLDPAARDEMLGLIQRIGHDFGISIVVTSHLLGELGASATRWSSPMGGRLLRASRTDEFLDATGALLVEVLGDDAQARMSAALTRAGSRSLRAEACFCRHGRRPPGRDRWTPTSTTHPTPRATSGSAWVRLQTDHRRIEDVFADARGTVSQPSGIPTTPDAGVSVIHDIGYRPVCRSRHGLGGIARALIVTGFL